MFSKINKFVVIRIGLVWFMLAGAFGVIPVRAGSGNAIEKATAALDERPLSSFQADGWDVPLDLGFAAVLSPEASEAFSPPASTTIGNWSALGSNPAGTDGAISHPGPSGIAQEVDVIAVSGTDVYVGGCFLDAGGDPTADYIAKWDGISWSGIGNDGTATPNGALKSCIRAMAINGSDIYVGGYPNVWVNGAPAPQGTYLAKWNGTSWSGLIGTNGSYIGGQVTSIAIGGNNVYVGGYFSNIYKWDGVNWSALGNNGQGGGALFANGGTVVETIKILNSDLYIGGNFTDVYNGLDLVPEAAYIAKWDTLVGNWSALGSNGDLPGGSINDWVLGLATDGTNLYAAGAFEDINNYGTTLTAADYVAKWDGTNWSALGSNGSGDGALNGLSFPIQIDGSDLYVGGAFTNINNNGTVLNAADYVAKWDGMNWSALGSNGGGNGSLNHAVFAFGSLGGNLFVGGRFTDVNNNDMVLNTADYIAAYGIGDGVHRVTPGGASTSPCGHNWANPCDLQYALTSLATPGDEIWVAAGTYKPTTGTDRTISFTLKNGVAVYGGFAGTETLRMQRDPAVNVTILSGDLNGNDNSNVQYDEPTRADNSYHVVAVGGANNTFVIDGFMVTAGNANGAPLYQHQDGGGIYNNGGNLIIANAVISGNSAELVGGAAYNYGTLTITNSTISGNSANNGGGGIANTILSNLTITNSTFSNNWVSKVGGGIANIGTLTITNSTLSGNSASEGGGIHNDGTMNYSNTIIGNSTGSDCYNQSSNKGTIGINMNNLVETNAAVPNNCGNPTLIADPQLGSLAYNGGFTQTMALLPGSPAIDAGDNANCPATDQRGVTRPQGSRCDMGAYEYEYEEMNVRFPAADFNGDGKTDVAVFRPGNSTWYIQGVGSFAYGQAGDIPVPADYNGDGKDDIAVFRPTNSTWYIYGVGAFVYGTIGDIPVVADYNGDGKADIAVFRPTNSTWYILGVGPRVYGTVGDIPVVADYNGDGKDDIAVFRPTNSTWYIYGVGSRVYGTVGDIPVVADYDGDGKADIAVFRPTNSTWYLYGIGPRLYGTVGDLPVIGDYNGDGKADIAVFRPTNSTWYIYGVGPSVYGTVGDIPV